MEFESSDSDEDILSKYAPADARPPSSSVPKRKIEKKPFISGVRNVVQSPIGNAISQTPTGLSPANAKASEKYGSRKNKGDVIFRYKCKDSGAWEAEKTQDKAACEIKNIEPTSKCSNDYNFKYMFQKVKEMSLTMNNIVQTVGTEICDQLEKEEENAATDGTTESADSATESQAEERLSYSRASLDEMAFQQHRYVGRIRSDGKLTSESVYFEGSMEDSDGHVVTLDLSALEEYHIFPGQIAVVEGKTEMKCLRVNKIHEPRLLCFPTISSNDYGRRGAQAPLNIMIAVGPFNPVDSMKFDPLEDLINVVTRDEPDVCFLLGPFFEASHPKIDEVGNAGHTFDQMFQHQLKLLMDKLSTKSTRIVLVPSYKDVNCQMVYPTPPYSTNGIKDSEKKIWVLPDPGTVSVNGVVVSVTSTDILMHLSKNELSNSTIGGDRMGRLARHVLTQQSFYPLYPPEMGVPFDVEHHAQIGRLRVRPHVLILPSDLRYFIKEVDGTIVVNPEHLTKGSSGGTFARIQVDLLTPPENEPFTSIADFCIGEIIKI